MSAVGSSPRSPWRYAPSLGFINGFGTAAAMNVSVLMYKSLGYSNQFIGYISLLFIPFTVAFLWTPALDGAFRKRGLTLALNWLLAAALGALALAVLLLPLSTWLTLSLLTAVALAGATFETAYYGFCLHAMGRAQQAAFLGVRFSATRLGVIFAGGILVRLCSSWSQTLRQPALSWPLVFGALAALATLAALYHVRALPKPPSDLPAGQVESGAFRIVTGEFCRLPRVGLIVAFLLTYRFGEGLLTRMVVPFLLDPSDRGGMNFTVGDAALAYGAIGMVFSVSGGLAGGWLIKCFGLRKVMLPFALCMVVPHLAYIWLALAKPSTVLVWRFGSHSYAFNPAVQSCVAIELFGYGLGYASFGFLAVMVSLGRFRASHSAICQAIASVGWLVPLTISGWVQSRVGYPALFALSVLTSIPGLVLLFALPLKRLEENYRREVEGNAASAAPVEA